MRNHQQKYNNSKMSIARFCLYVLNIKNYFLNGCNRYKCLFNAGW